MILTGKTVYNVNPIFLARASGLSILFLCLTYWHGKTRFMYFAVLMMPYSIGLLASATRGPVIALVIAIILSTLLLRRDSEGFKKAQAILLASGLAFVSAIAGLYDLKSASGKHLSSFETGN